MKRGTPDHPKMRSLARTLCVCRAHAVGILEMLWHFTANYAPDGSLAKFSPEEIAESVTWTKDPAKLVDSLKKSCWLDEDMFIHDWPLHCEDSTHMRLFRANHPFACGCTPKSSRISKKEKSHSHVKHTVCARHAHGVSMLCAPPMPLPLPLPKPDTSSDESLRESDSKTPKYSKGQIEEIYKAYPRRVAKADAIKAIEKALRSVDYESLLKKVQEYATSREGQDQKFTPYPASWFNKGQWGDELEDTDPGVHTVAWWNDPKHPERLATLRGETDWDPNEEVANDA